jgi:hypothetical protein
MKTIKDILVESNSLNESKLQTGRSAQMLLVWLRELSDVLQGGDYYQALNAIKRLKQKVDSIEKDLKQYRSGTVDDLIELGSAIDDGIDSAKRNL